MEKERLIRSEQRNQTVEKELDEIKTDYKDLNQVEKRISKENIEMKENTKVMNSNLKKQMEINSIREQESKAL
jgi:F0F1-type ATP synthase membrane subunit b/b'